MRIYLGIDWSHTHHDACFLNEGGLVLSRLTVPHSAEGLAQLDTAREKLGVRRDECWIGLETAHTLLIDFLWERGYVQVFVIPPGAIKGARRRYRQSNAHTDQTDAVVAKQRVIADVVRTDPKTLQPWRPDGLIVRQLRAKVSLLQFLTQDIRRLDNRLGAVLARYYPAALQVFHEPTAAIALHFLQAFPSPQAAATLTLETFTRFARAHLYRQPARVLTACFARLQAPYPTAMQAPFDVGKVARVFHRQLAAPIPIGLLTRIARPHSEARPKTLPKRPQVIAQAAHGLRRQLPAIRVEQIAIIEGNGVIRL